MSNFDQMMHRRFTPEDRTGPNIDETLYEKCTMCGNGKQEICLNDVYDLKRDDGGEVGAVMVCMACAYEHAKDRKVSRESRKRCGWE
ncbi:MAG: hypothetical protein OEV86_13030 [Candidatus Krumholzibacteria bacterium]|nr:hypothetical protein [Candidatus Krumholzibacteria bacterium]